MGVEPTSVAWEATVLPMNYARVMCNPSTIAPINPSGEYPILQAHTQNPEVVSVLARPIRMVLRFCKDVLRA